MALKTTLVLLGLTLAALVVLAVLVLVGSPCGGLGSDRYFSPGDAQGGQGRLAEDEK